MKLSDLPVGTEIYNAGDMANPDKFGSVTSHTVDRWGERVDIVYTDGTVSRGIAPCQFSDKYLGHHGTRFVTKAAYKKWYADHMAAYTYNK